MCILRFIIYVPIGTEGSIITIISPLTALMLDQKQNFSQKGLTVDYIGEDQTNLSAVIEGKIQLVYMSLETLVGNWTIRKMFRSTVYKNNLVGFVVDEAHCVKTW